METWSSVAALVERESTEEGWHKALFSETAKIQRNECRMEWARDSRSNGQPGAKSLSTTSGSTIAPFPKMHQRFYLDWIICNKHLKTTSENSNHYQFIDANINQIQKDCSLLPLRLGLFWLKGVMEMKNRQNNCNRSLVSPVTSRQLSWFPLFLVTDTAPTLGLSSRRELELSI